MCKGKRTVRSVEVPVKASSLTTGDVFLLDLGDTIFVYNGSGANRAEVEYADAPSLLMPSAEITRGCAEDGACLIERAVNSARVSVRVRQCDELEEILARALCKSLGRRADAFEVLRRAPVEGYDVSFLVLLEHAERMEAKGLVDFVVTFMEDVDKEISEQKLSVSSRGRTVAAAYLKQFA